MSITMTSCRRRLHSSTGRFPGQEIGTVHVQRTMRTVGQPGAVGVPSVNAPSPTMTSFRRICSDDEQEGKHATGRRKRTRFCEAMGVES